MLTLLIGRVAQLLVAAATMRVMTTLLEPTQVGQVALVATTTALFALLLVNPLGMFINRRLHGWTVAGVVRPYFHLFFGYLILVAMLAGILAAASAANGWVPASLPATGVALLVAGSLLFNSVIQTLVPSLNLLGRARIFAVLSVGGLLLNLTLSIVFVRVGGASALLWMAGAVVGQALLAPFAYAIFFAATPSRLRGKPVDLPRLRNLFAFAWPVAIAVGLGWAQLQGYRFLIANESGLAALGLFSAGYGLAAALMSALEQILTTWFQPAFYRAAASHDPQVHASAWKRYAGAMLPLSLTGMLALVASAPEFVALMLGPAFQSVAIYTILGAVAECARVWVGVFTLAAHIQLRTRLLLLPNALGTALTLVLMLVLLPTFGLLVAPLSVAAGGLVICALLYRTAVAGQGIRFPILPLALASVAGAAGIAASALMRSMLLPSGPVAHPATIAFVAAIFAPVAWHFMRLARSDGDIPQGRTDVLADRS